MCDNSIATGIYIVDNSPEYKDSLDLKFEFFSEDEYNHHTWSQDSGLSIKESSAPVLNLAEEPKLNIVTPSLEERVARRVGSALSRLEMKERSGNNFKYSMFSSSQEEVLEFMKIFTNGVKVQIKEPLEEIKKPKRGRGRPRKYPLTVKQPNKRRGRKRIEKINF